MFRPQFSIAGLLGVVTFVAVACAALVKPSEWWASILVTTTVVAIVAAGLSAWFHRGPRRNFAASFTVVGAAYLWLVFGHAFSATMGARLLTTFHVIGQSLWTCILAAAGGWIAAHWHARRRCGPVVGHSTPG